MNGKHVSASEAPTSETVYEAKCPDCGEMFPTHTPPELREPHEVCARCFEAFDGLTLEEFFK